MDTLHSPVLLHAAEKFVVVVVDAGGIVDFVDVVGIVDEVAVVVVVVVVWSLGLTEVGIAWG